MAQLDSSSCKGGERGSPVTHDGSKGEEPSLGEVGTSGDGRLSDERSSSTGGIDKVAHHAKGGGGNDDA